MVTEALEQARVHEFGVAWSTTIISFH
jgi:hypothetical protein